MRIPVVAAVLVAVLAACGDGLPVAVKIIVSDARDPTEIRWGAPYRSEALREGNGDVFVLEEVFAGEAFVPEPMVLTSFDGSTSLGSFDVYPLDDCTELAAGYPEEESGALTGVQLSIGVDRDGSARAYQGECYYENGEGSWIVD